VEPLDFAKSVFCETYLAGRRCQEPYFDQYDFPTAMTLKSYVGVLRSLWLFLFPIFLLAAQPKEFFLDELKKLEQRSHKCVELRGEYVE
jgi:hypothetical protein